MVALPCSSGTPVFDGASWLPAPQMHSWRPGFEDISRSLLAEMYQQRRVFRLSGSQFDKSCSSGLHAYLSAFMLPQARALHARIDTPPRPCSACSCPCSTLLSLALRLSVQALARRGRHESITALSGSEA